MQTIEVDLWCKRCKAFRIIFIDNPDIVSAVEDFGYVIGGSCVFCRGPLVPVTPEIIAEYPGEQEI